MRRALCRWLAAPIIERINLMVSVQQAQADQIAARLDAVGEQLQAGFRGLTADLGDLRAKAEAGHAIVPVDFARVEESLSRVVAVAESMSALDAQYPAVEGVDAPDDSEAGEGDGEPVDEPVDAPVEGDGVEPGQDEDEDRPLV